MHNNRHANYTHIHMNAPTHARTCTHMHNNNGQSWCSPRRAKNVLHVSHRTDSHWRIATSKPFCASHIFIALIPRTNIRILLLMVFAISLRSFSIWNDGVLWESFASFVRSNDITFAREALSSSLVLNLICQCGWVHYSCHLLYQFVGAFPKDCLAVLRSIFVLFLREIRSNCNNNHVLNITCVSNTI